MKTWAAVTVTMGLAVAAAGATEGDAPAVDSAEPAPTFFLQIHNRMFPEWSERVDVGLNEEFFLGDTEYTATAVRYLPDFRIDESGRRFSVSEEPNNPALHVVVYRDTTAVDSVWAFRNFPPHWSPKSFFAFKLLDGASSDELVVQENGKEE